MLDTVGSVVEILGDLQTVNLSSDQNDNMILTTVLKGRVDYLASSDKRDLLLLETVQYISIITARKAVSYFGIVDS